MVTGGTQTGTTQSVFSLRWQTTTSLKANREMTNIQMLGSFLLSKHRMVEAEWCYLQRCQPAVDILASVRSIWLQVHSVRHKSNLQNKQILKEGQRPAPGRLIYRAPCKITNMLIDFQLRFENGLQTAGGGWSIFAVWWFHSYHMQ